VQYLYGKKLLSNFTLEMTGLFHYNKQEFYRNVQQSRITIFCGVSGGTWTTTDRFCYENRHVLELLVPIVYTELKSPSSLIYLSAIVTYS